MKKILFLLSFFTLSAVASFAQIAFRTGSADFDASLNSINANAQLDLGAFKADLSVSFGMPRQEVDNLFSIGMEPGEVYLALEIGRITRKPIDDVIVVYRDYKSKGWGVIAKELGIKPGSSEFHALKGKAKTKSAKGKSGGSASSGGKGNGGGGKGKKK